jgi:hypothetical protein
MTKTDKQILFTLIDAGFKSLGLVVHQQFPGGFEAVAVALKKLEQVQEPTDGNDHPAD